jgi:hypothetical protein
VTCRIGHLVSIWQSYKESSFQQRHESMELGRMHGRLRTSGAVVRSSGAVGVLTRRWGSHCTADTILPLLCVRSAKDWCSVIVFSRWLPEKPSSSASAAKSSSKMSAAEFWSSARSHLAAGTPHKLTVTTQAMTGSQPNKAPANGPGRHQAVVAAGSSLPSRNGSGHAVSAHSARARARNAAISGDDSTLSRSSSSIPRGSH